MNDETFAAIAICGAPGNYPYGHEITPDVCRNSVTDIVLSEKNVLNCSDTVGLLRAALRRVDWDEVARAMKENRQYEIDGYYYNDRRLFIIDAAKIVLAIAMIYNANDLRDEWKSIDEIATEGVQMWAERSDKISKEEFIAAFEILKKDGWQYGE